MNGRRIEFDSACRLSYYNGSCISRLEKIEEIEELIVR